MIDFEKRAWAILQATPTGASLQYTMIALRQLAADVLEEAATVSDGWVEQYGDKEIEYTSAREYATSAVKDISDILRTRATAIKDGKQ
jgi:hypothetical protein